MSWRRIQGLAHTPIMMVVGRFGAIAFAFVSVTVIARTLGPSGRGVTAGMLGVLTIAPIALGAGVPLAVRRRVTVGQSRASTMAAARMYCALTLVPAVLAGAGVDALLFQELAPAERLAFHLSMAAVPLGVSWAIDLNVLLAELDYLRVGVLSLIQPATNCFALLTLAGLSLLDTPSVLYATLAANVIAFVAGRLWVGGPTLGCVLGLWDLTREGTTLVGGRIAEVSSRRLDQVVALPLLGAPAAGIYSVAVTVASLSMPVSQSLGAAAFRDLVTDNPHLLHRTIRQAFALAAMSAAALALVAYAAMPLAFGSDYAASRNVALLAILGSASANVGFVASMALAARQRGGIMTFGQVMGTVVGIALFFPLGSLQGAIGGAAAMTIGVFCGTATLLWALRLSPLACIPHPRDFAGALRTLAT